MPYTHYIVANFEQILRGKMLRVTKGYVNPKYDRRHLMCNPWLLRGPSIDPSWDIPWPLMDYRMSLYESSWTILDFLQLLKHPFLTPVKAYWPLMGGPLTPPVSPPDTSWDTSSLLSLRLVHIPDSAEHCRARKLLSSSISLMGKEQASRCQ